MTQAAGARAVSHPYTRWNFVVIVLDAAFFGGALAFVDPVAVLPVLLSQLTDSEVIVGLMSTLQRAGWLVPQLIATSFVLHRPRRKPFVLYPVLIGRAPFLLLAFAFSTAWGAARPQMLLASLIAVWGFFFFLDGLVGVPWHDICARTIPPRLRGRFFGSIQLVGGIIAVGAGAVVQRVLADPSVPFPFNYGRLFVLLFVFMAISTAFVALIREPPDPPTAGARSLLGLLRDIPATLREHARLKRLIVAQVLCGVGGLAMPFYAVYADLRLGLPPAVGGIFVWAAIIGSLSASMVWAHLSDHRGSTSVIRGAAVVMLLVPLTALLIPPIVRILGAAEGMAYCYAAVFLLNGAVWGGTWIGFTNYVLEIAPDDLRPLFLGLQATLSVPSVVAPLLGGILLKVLSFEALFAIVAAGSVLALIYAYRLREPRRAEGEIP